jgi:PAS domain S-box-containing protein
MADSAPVMIWVTNGEGAFSYINTQFRRFFGAEGTSAVSDWDTLVLPPDREALDAVLAAAIADRRPFRIECRVRRHDSSVRWLLLSGAVRENAGGEILGLVGSGVDITERRHAEALLEVQNQTLERVAIGIEADYCLHALVQSLESEMQGAYCALLKAEPDGKHLSLGSAPSLPAAFRTLLEALPIGPDEGSCGTAAFRREPVVVSDIASDPLWEKYRAAALQQGLRACTSVPLLGRHGEVLGTIAVYYATATRPPTWDVQLLSTGSSLASVVLERASDENAVHAAHASLEARVRERTTELEAANKELEAFSYSVSHDLRSPLRTIDGFAQIVSQRYRDRLDTEAQAYLDRVRAGCQRMSELIDDLLRLSMVTRGGATRQDVDLSDLARQVIDGLQQANPERRVAVRIGAGLRVRGDPKLLRVLLENLLGNAWKFTAKRPLAEISFGAEVVDGEVVYKIADNGAGFDMKYADRLFSPFERLHHRDQFEGTGIGLATAQRVVRLHGGRIWAQSAPDAGTTLRFTLG